MNARPELGDEIRAGRSANLSSDNPSSPPSPAGLRSIAAFTLLEVMIAVAILFMCMFAILGLVNQSLRSARVLQRPQGADFTSVAAQLLLTNRIEEGSVSGDFGDAYPGFDWSADVYQVASNGLFQVDFLVRERVQGWDKQNRYVEAKSGILMFRPESAVNTGIGRR
jgi:Tfp pilus assembly protein PilV